MTSLGSTRFHRHPATIVLVGGGGHAVVVAEAAGVAGAMIAGFLDDNPAASVGVLPFNLPHPFPIPPFLGTLADLGKLKGHEWIVGLGDVAHRRQMLRSLERAGLLAPPPGHAERPATVIHPSAQISPSALIEPGVFVGPLGNVHSRVRIAGHAIVNSSAIVEHDCVIGENTHIAPGAVLGGAVQVGTDCLLGLGCRVVPGVKIGDRCIVGAGAVVIRDLPAGSTVIGVPARKMG